MPGTVTLFGSGETSAAGGRIFDALARQVQGDLNISVLETPAGFELNAQRVAGRIVDFLSTRLQNYHPRISQVAARKKGTAHSPDDPEVVDAMYQSGIIFLGPGSPTYAVRHLRGSLAWDILQARHRLGAHLVFASAAAIAAGSLALPVYEIFKAGEDPHWKPGLDLLAPFGLSLIVVPHWNNQDGGGELDTSRCFLGQERFDLLLQLLPPGSTVLGIDEQTAVTLDFLSSTCTVGGLGGAHVHRSDAWQVYPSGCQFPLLALGQVSPPAHPEAGLSPQVWRQAVQAARELEEQAAASMPVPESSLEIPPELRQMVEDRETARRQHDWARADQLRQQIADLGWKVIDSPAGPRVLPRS